MEYYTYWSIQDTPSHTIKAYMVFLIIAICSIVGWILVSKFKKSDSGYEKSILLYCIGAIAIVSVAGFFSMKFIFTDNNSQEVLKLLNSPKVQNVEGTISNFRQKSEQKRYGTVTTETFQVDSVTFWYTDALLGRFNTFSKTNNGIFHNGLPVRITFLKGNGQYDFDGNQILKIEIANK